jgi:hypothetical protein
MARAKRAPRRQTNGKKKKRGIERGGSVLSVGGEEEERGRECEEKSRCDGVECDDEGRRREPSEARPPPEQTR